MDEGFENFYFYISKTFCNSPRELWLIFTEKKPI